MAEQNEKAPRRIGVHEFRGDLTGFLRQARQGASFVITSDDQAVAEIRPPPKADRPPRQLGALQGQIWMSPDFDDFPADILAAMEGEEG